LLVLVNHFKSKGYSSPAVSDSKRKRQANRVRDIYKDRLNQGFEFIAIVGDLNDTPNSDPLQPLLGNELGLTDIMTHDIFTGDGRPGKEASVRTDTTGEKLVESKRDKNITKERGSRKYKTVLC